ncbi:MAG: putative DNA binding domain-containing protein [Anaerolineae bacterium]|uniref:ATP-binding protein n=1 Tax=Candidatus Amarolinea dominans TaxID=3140696 RepID=UPI003136FF01|nr:putative DNA binding domain-containing protein [Anaerolineae bacterium]
MNVDLTRLQAWLSAGEDEHLEFKEARNRYDFEELVKYCVALANEGGGTMILGVTDRRPRHVVGSQAFTDLERTKAGLIERLRLRVDVAVLQHPDGRVIVFSVPSRPMGVPIQYHGAYWMRGGEDLIPMTPDLLKRIFDEAGPDFSAEICPQAVLADLDPAAIGHFRAMWQRKSGNKALEALPVAQLLADAELVVRGGVTYAALVLFEGSVFVRQYPRRLEVVSPGGFPPGITLENILWRQAPRNRRIAEAFARCGLVERAGQGMNRIFEECIRESKPQPDFRHSDAYQVALTLRGEIQDPQFLRFLEQVGQERLAAFVTQDFLLLDLVHREQPIPDQLRDRLPFLVDQGLIERTGRGRGVRYMLSRALYAFLGQGGIYTRKKGLDRETNKALLFKHIQDNRTEGTQFGELTQVLPSLTHDQVQRLLRNMQADRQIHKVGRTRGARWFPGPGAVE